MGNIKWVYQSITTKDFPIKLLFGKSHWTTVNIAQGNGSIPPKAVLIQFVTLSESSSVCEVLKQVRPDVWFRNKVYHKNQDTEKSLQIGFDLDANDFVYNTHWIMYL